MIVESKQSFTIDGVTYEANKEYVLGKDVVEHWYFQALIKDGTVKILKADEKPKEVIDETEETETVADEKPKEASKGKKK